MNRKGATARRTTVVTTACDEGRCDGCTNPICQHPCHREDADTARRLGLPEARRHASKVLHQAEAERAEIAAREDAMDALPTTSVTSSAPPVGEIQRIPANLLGSELRSIAARLLHLRTHLDDDPHDEELRRAVVRLRDLSDGATPRPPQAAGDANDPGDDAGAAHAPHGAAAGHTEPPMRPEDVPAPEHAHNGNEQANEQALRDRIASAIENRAHLCLIECDCDGDHPILVTTSAGDAESGPHIIAVEGSPRAFADAVMAEVQAELDQHWADLACRTNERDQWREEARRMHQNCDHWRKRAEAAEAQLRDQQNGDQT